MKVKVELLRDIELESVPVMFGSERKERNRVIVVTSQFDLDLIFKGLVSQVRKVIGRSMSNSFEILT